MKTVFLELGVGYNTPGNMNLRAPFLKWSTKLENTPGIIKYSFWQRTAENPLAAYVCINYRDAAYPTELENQAIGIQEDIGKCLQKMFS